MNNRLLLLGIFFLILIGLTSCTAETINENIETPFLHSNSSTPTPTPTNFLELKTTVIPNPVNEEAKLEIHIPYQVENSTVTAVPGEGNECIQEISFTISSIAERRIASGKGIIDCHYTIEPGDIPYRIDLTIQGDASFDGELLPASDDFQAGFLDSFLNFNGTITQYYSDFQVPLTNACPEENPCIAPGSEIFNLPFHWENGDQIESNWIFILYKQPNQ